MASLILFEHRLKAVFEAFEEAVDFNSLRYSAYSLQRFGFKDDAAVNRAINRAIRVCKSCEINPRKHFRPYYKVDIVNKQTSREWRVSKMGFYLVLCNGEPGNPYVGAFQLELLRQALHQLE
jgi:hypothetical protein